MERLIFVLQSEHTEVHGELENTERERETFSSITFSGRKQGEIGAHLPLIQPKALALRMGLPAFSAFLSNSVNSF